MSAAGHAPLKNPDGSWKYTNALAKETSPYLLQHAHNPVDWHPWGEEAFRLARETGRPIFLSIGYSTCYWCHVMERQCFENPEIAKLMNDLFVCIKVDREERPDVDDIYMTATQAMTGRGGWPMSVFLTPPGAKGPDDPGLKPFWAGTYIPPTPQHGLPSFPQVLQGLSNAWKTRRAEVIEQADRLAQAVRQHLGNAAPGEALTLATASEAAKQLMAMFDRDHGGFGDAPKFPQPINLTFLLRTYAAVGDEGIADAIRLTLDRMARGGMYDQIGGGFHRYSVDEKWLVPHFEKMLYDNAQLVEAYLAADEVLELPDGRREQSRRIVRETCDYVLREMTDQTGAFWSAQDAEVEAREGGNYIWTPEEVRAAVADRDLAELTLEMYGLNLGPNFRDPHDPDAPPVNVLYLPRPLHKLAEARGMTLEELLTRRRTINRALHEARMKRPQPGTDDKVIVAWNGMMIAALARAGRQLSEARYLDAAKRAANAILTHMRSGDGGLLRTLRGGQAKVNAFLEDYANLAHGLIELHRATDEPRWLSEAKNVIEVANERFAAEHGGYFDTLADQADLFVRTRGSYDGALPGGNSVMAHNLLDLYGLTGDEAHLDRAVGLLQSFGGELRTLGAGMAHMQAAVLRMASIAPDRMAAEEADESPVRLELSTDRIDLSKGTGKLTVTLRIGPPWHLNAHDPGDEALVGTRLELRDAPGLKLDVHYPPGVEKRFPFADVPIRVYEGDVTLAAVISATGDSIPRNARPRIVLHFQACDDSTCALPAQFELPVKIELGAR